MFKTLLRTTCVTLGLSIAPIAVLAQSSQPVQVVVPYNPGGGSDLFGRMVAPAIGKALEKTAIVENRAGAGGIIGTETVTRSTPPSQMLLVSDSAVYTIIPSLYSPLGYAAKDLIPVANIAAFGNVLVVPTNSRFKTFQDVLDEARKSPNKLTIGSSGAGGITHLAAERLMEQAKIKLVHVPYKGSGPAITDTVGGHIDMVFTGLPSVLELLRSGKLRALAIGTEQRSPYAQDIPTISESGVPGFSAMISQGLFAPAHTSPETVQKLNKAVRDFMNQPDTKETLRKMTVDPVDQSSADYKAWLDKEGQEWAALIKRADIKVQ